MNPSKKNHQRAPGAPKRFKSSFILYFMDVQESIKKSIPPGRRSSVAEVSKIASHMWKSISAEERKYWDKEGEKEKIRFAKEKKSYEGPWTVVKKKVKKDPTAPKRNASSFLLYSVEKRWQLKKQYPTLKFVEISRLLGIEWRNAAYMEKLPFIEREKEERKVYKLRMEKWKKEKEESLRCNSRNGSILDEDQALSTLSTTDPSKNAIGETGGVTQTSTLSNLQQEKINNDGDVSKKTKENIRNDSVSTNIELQGPNENEKKNLVPLISLSSEFPKNLGSEGRKSSSQEDNESLSSVQKLNKDIAISRKLKDDCLMGMISQSKSRPSSGLSVHDKQSIERRNINYPQHIQPRTAHEGPLNSCDNGGIHYINLNPAMNRDTNTHLGPLVIVPTVDSFALPTHAQIDQRSTMVSESIAPYPICPGQYSESNRSLLPMPCQDKECYPPTVSDYQGRYSTYGVPQTPQHMRPHYSILTGDNRLLCNNVGMMDTTFAPVNEAQYEYLPTQFEDFSSSR